jgi:hypothetical protein
MVVAAWQSVEDFFITVLTKYPSPNNIITMMKKSEQAENDQGFKSKGGAR